VLLTGLAIAAIASAFGNALPVATVLGAGLALSSTAIVMQVLGENRRLGTATGRACFAILLLQDLAVLPILFLIAAFARQGDGAMVPAFALAVGQAVAAVVAILAAGRLAVRPLFRLVGGTASREMFLALVLLMIVGTALATAQAGLSMALGAFLAGLLMAETEYRHEIAVDIEPFKGLLLGLFFASVGMSIDVAQVAASPIWLALSVAGLFLVKGSIVCALARLFGEPRAVALEAAMLLGQGGEFALVIIGLAAGLGVMPADTAQFMLIVTGLTMFATPSVAHAARRLARAVEAWEVGHGQPAAGPPADLAGHAIVVGYGRVGRMVGSIVESQGLPHVALDIDASLVARFRAAGASVFFGDASRPDMLRKLGVERAAALVVTMDSPTAAERVVAVARRHWPELAICARAHDVDHAMRLIAGGASHVVPEATEASLQLGELVLMAAGVPEPAARHVVEARRQAEQAAVDESRRDEPG
jgi:CPA2 family monovalent cation:H+ antiporter-2